MGYESRRAFRVEFPDGMNLAILETKYREALVAIDADNDYELRNLFDEMYEDNDTFACMTCGWQKLYDSFPECQAFESMLEYLESEIDRTESGGYHVVEFGENYDDFNERCYGDLDEYIQLIRDFDL